LRQPTKDFDLTKPEKILNASVESVKKERAIFGYKISCVAENLDATKAGKEYSRLTFNIRVDDSVIFPVDLYDIRELDLEQNPYKIAVLYIKMPEIYFNGHLSSKNEIEEMTRIFKELTLPHG